MRRHSQAFLEGIKCCSLEKAILLVDSTENTVYLTIRKKLIPLKLDENLTRPLATSLTKLRHKLKIKGAFKKNRVQLDYLD